MHYQMSVWHFSSPKSIYEPSRVDLMGRIWRTIAVSIFWQIIHQTKIRKLLRVLFCKQKILFSQRQNSSKFKTEWFKVQSLSRLFQKNPPGYRVTWNTNTLARRGNDFSHDSGYLSNHWELQAKIKINWLISLGDYIPLKLGSCWFQHVGLFTPTSPSLARARFCKHLCVSVRKKTSGSKFIIFA